MPRKHRLFAPGSIFHIIQRGVNRRDIFLDEEDCERFLALCGETVEQHDFQILAYVLMRNHVHLAVRCGSEPLGKPMQTLFFRYAAYFNRKHKRVGHLYQGRYKSILVSTNPYVQQLIAYIHLNPVRAGIVARPDQYRYSSYNAIISGSGPDWLDDDAVLRLFARRRGTARRKLAEFTAAQIGNQALPDFKRGNNKEHDALAPDGYMTKIRERAEIAHFNAVPLDRIIEAVLREYDMAEAELTAPGRQRRPAEARALIVHLVRTIGDGRVSVAAERLQREQSVLSHGVARIRARIASEPEMRKRFERLARALGRKDIIQG